MRGAIFLHDSHILSRFWPSFLIYLFNFVFLPCDKWNWNMYQKAKGNVFNFLFVNSQKFVCITLCVYRESCRNVRRKSGFIHRWNALTKRILSWMIGLGLYKYEKYQEEFRSIYIDHAWNFRKCSLQLSDWSSHCRCTDKQKIKRCWTITTIWVNEKMSAWIPVRNQCHCNLKERKKKYNNKRIMVELYSSTTFDII